MSTYTVTIKVPGTVGKRATATRRVTVWADDHADAVRRAQAKLRDAASYEVKLKYA